MNEQSSDTVRKSFYRNLRSGLWRSLLAVGMFSMLINLLALTVPVFMLQIFDRVISSGNLDTLILMTVMAACALITLALLDIIRNSILIALGTWIDQRLSAAAMEATVSAAATSGKSPSSQMLVDLTAVRKVFRKSAILPVFDAPWAPVFLLIIFILSPVLGWVAFTGLALIFALAVGQDSIKAYLMEKSRKASRPTKGHAKSLMRNADSAMAMGMVSTLTQSWTSENKQSLDTQASKERADATFSAMMKFVMQGLRIAMFALGAMLVVQDSITMGVMIASVLLVGRALIPVSQMVRSRRSIVEARAAFKRVKTGLEQTPAKRFREVFDIPAGGLSLKKLRYRYSGSKATALRQVTLDLDPGDALCVVGPTGSGKSTMAKLLTGILQPRSGHVLLGGVPVDSLAPEARALHIGYLPPEPQLFDGTIYENIARMRTGSQHAVAAAARLAGVHDAIIRLPEGYDTRIGSGKSVLSRGETRLISLARAIYGDPRLVVLDEPGEALDNSSEKQLLNVIEALKLNGAIVIVVSHRSAVMRRCDQTLTLPGGRTKAARTLAREDLKVIEDGQDRKLIGNSGQNDG